MGDLVTSSPTETGLEVCALHEREFCRSCVPYLLVGTVILGYT